MIRWGIRRLLLAVLLFVVAFAGAWSGWFEIARLSGVGCLVLGLALLLVDHLPTGIVYPHWKPLAHASFAKPGEGAPADSGKG